MRRVSGVLCVLALLLAFLYRGGAGRSAEDPKKLTPEGLNKDRLQALLEKARASFQVRHKADAGAVHSALGDLSRVIKQVTYQVKDGKPGVEVDARASKAEAAALARALKGMQQLILFALGEPTTYEFKDVKFARMDRKDIDKIVAGVRLVGLAAPPAASDARIKKLEDALKKLEPRIRKLEALEDALKKLTPRLDKLEKAGARVKVLEARLASLEKTAKAVAPRLTKLEAMVKASGPRLTRLEAAVKASGPRLTRLEAAVKAVGPRLVALDKELTKLRGANGDLSKKLSRAEEQLAAEVAARKKDVQRLEADLKERPTEEDLEKLGQGMKKLEKKFQDKVARGEKELKRLRAEIKKQPSYTIDVTVEWPSCDLIPRDITAKVKVKSSRPK
jgi:DNA repair exonuclease SbcCD ATPase subunit